MSRDLGFHAGYGLDQEGVKVFASFGRALLRPDLRHVSFDEVLDAPPARRKHSNSGAGATDVKAKRARLVEHVLQDHLLRP